MNQNLSRRDFLKIAGVGLGSLAFNPLKRLEFPPPLPQFPEGDRLGRVFSRIDVRSEPNFNAPSVGVLYDDQIVVWQQELVTRGRTGSQCDRSKVGEGSGRLYLRAASSTGEEHLKHTLDCHPCGSIRVLG